MHRHKLFIQSLTLAALLGFSNQPGFSQVDQSRVLTVQIENASRAQIDRLDTLVRNRQWRRAAETFDAIFDESDAGLVQIAATSNLSTAPVTYWRRQGVEAQTWFAKISSEHTELLDEYRELVDARARILYREAKKNRDQRLFEQIAERYFFSSLGDEILFELGSIYFQNGQTDQARRCWSTIDGRFERFKRNHGTTVSSSTIFYRESDLDLPQVAAQLIVLDKIEKQSDRVKRDLNWFETEFPDHQPRWSGRRGRLRDLIDEVNPQSPPTPTDKRKVMCDDSIPLDPSGTPVWTIQLPTVNVQRTDIVKNVFPNRLNRQYPILFDGNILFFDGFRIRMIDLKTGRPTFPAGEPIDNDPITCGEVWRPLDVPAEKEVFENFLSPVSMVANQGAIFCRIGGKPSMLIGLDMRRQAQLVGGFPIKPPRDAMRFSGYPVVAGHRLFVAGVVEDSDQNLYEVVVLCYQLSSSDDATALKPVWQTTICRSEPQRDFSSAQDSNAIVSNVFLTAHRGRLYCNTNAGAIAALETEAGTVQWITQYSRVDWFSKDPDAVRLPAARSVNPCVVDGEQVFVMPSDSEQVFAINRSDGQLNWTRELAEASEMIHVGKRQIVLSGLRLLWLDRYSGVPLCAFPQNVVSPQAEYRKPALKGWGRPMVSGGLIYFPTKSRIFIVRLDPAKISDENQQTRLVPQILNTIDLASRRLTGGHLLSYRGMMLIIQRDRICAFTSNGQPDFDFD